MGKLVSLETYLADWSGDDQDRAAIVKTILSVVGASTTQAIAGVYRRRCDVEQPGGAGHRPGLLDVAARIETAFIEFGETLDALRGVDVGNAAKACGAKYLAVLTTPTSALPTSVPRNESSVSPNSMNAVSIRAATSSKPRPTGVGRMPSSVRSNNAIPAISSSKRICRFIAGGVTWSNRAAPDIVPACVTAVNARNCLSVMRRKSDESFSFIAI